MSSLDFGVRLIEKQRARMVPFSEIAYAACRVCALDVSFLRETCRGAPAERLLQLAWQHQRLQTDNLTLLDGRPLRILHPGFWNRGAGPDFRNAVIRIGEEEARSGDVEIDLHNRDWHQHAHDINPAYARVVLHVVWHPPLLPAAHRPVLVLEHRLDASIADLITWIDLDPGLPDNVIGRCASGLRRAGPGVVEALLLQAARFRFQRKGFEIAARARQAGWEQALFEGLCAGLGYQHNTWPMRRLAEQRTTLLGAESVTDLLQLQARLLGVSGLLPHEPARRRQSGDRYLRQLWDSWWRERESFASITLPRCLWRLDGIRPANHPQRRIALTAHWLLRSDLVRRLEHWLAHPCPDPQLATRLMECLQAGDDPFWSRHWTLTSAATPTGRPLLGPERTGDLAINVILPWFWVRAGAGNNSNLQTEALRRFLVWPAGQDNGALSLARLRLFGSIDRLKPDSAARQQGLLQIVRDFCGHSNALCDNCVLPGSFTGTPPPFRLPTRHDRDRRAP
jgi:hypothetical protein